MSKLAARKKRVKRTVSIGRVVPEAVEQVEDLDSRIEAIQWLIPLGLKAVTEELHRAVIECKRSPPWVSSRMIERNSVERGLRSGKPGGGK